jgi:Radical SAM superfamily/4Fe-4S single cluster domain
MSAYLNVERIEFIVTNRCNSNCRHCSIDKNKRKSKPAAIDIELAVKVIKDVAGKYSPQSLMTFGGEPLLFPEVVCAIHSTARDRGIAGREIITNAGWQISEDDSREMARKLAENGVTKMAISVDGFHREYISTTVVKQNVIALLDAGIPVVWNPCWVISKEHNNPWNTRTRAVLSELRNLPVPESKGNTVQPAGNALSYLAEYLPEKTASPDGSCEDVPYSSRPDRIKMISIEPNGDISICREFSIANAGKQNITGLLENYDPYQFPEMAAVLQGGTAKLEEYARQKGITPAAGGYYSICDKCVDLRRRLRETAT